jgi:hypothetical protein
MGVIIGGNIGLKLKRCSIKRNNLLSDYLEKIEEIEQALGIKAIFKKVA